MKKNRCVIIAGSDINNYDYIKTLLKSDDYYIFCDSGLKHLEKLGVKEDLIVGDFDSYDFKDFGVETIKLPCQKDDTDSFFAIKEAVKRGFDDFLLLGVIGKRFDHSLGNISILLYLDDLKKKALIVDDYSTMEIVNNNTAYITSKYKYFSVFAMGGAASGVDIRNAKYPLLNAIITPSFQYGISNEVETGSIASVSVEAGRLLLIKIRN